MKIKEAIKKLIYPNKYCSEAYVNFLRRGGAKIGEMFYRFGLINVPDEAKEKMKKAFGKSF